MDNEDYVKCNPDTENDAVNRPNYATTLQKHDIDYKYPFLYEEAEIDSPYKNVPKFIEFVWGKLT